MGKIISFYSYGNSVAPSIAIVKVSLALTEFGHSVLLIDWNFTKPDILHKLNHDASPFRVTQGDRRSGLAAFIEEWSKVKTNKMPDLTPYIMQVSTSVNSSNGTISFLPAVGDYSKNFLNHLKEYNRLAYKHDIWETLKSKLQSEYDVILINSSAGIGGVDSLYNSQQPDTILFYYEAKEPDIVEKMVIDYMINQSKETPQIDLIPILTRNCPVRCECDTFAIAIDEIISKKEKKYEWFKQLKVLDEKVYTEFAKRTLTVISTENNYEEELSLVFGRQKEIAPLIAALLVNKEGIGKGIELLVKNEKELRDKAVKSHRGKYKELEKDNFEWYRFEYSMESKHTMVIDRDNRIIIFAVDDQGKIIHFYQRSQAAYLEFSKPISVGSRQDAFTIHRGNDREFDAPLAIKDCNGRIVLFIRDINKRLYFTRQIEEFQWEEWRPVGKDNNPVCADGLYSVVCTEQGLNFFYDYKAVPEYTKEYHEKKCHVDCSGVSYGIYRIEMDQKGNWSEPHFLGIPPLTTKHKHGAFNPQAIISGNNILVFVRASDGEVWVYECPLNEIKNIIDPERWHTLGGICYEHSIKVMYGPDNRLHAFHIGTDGTIYRRWFETDNPQNWDQARYHEKNPWYHDLGRLQEVGVFFSDFNVIVNSCENRIELFALSSANKLFHCKQIDNSLTPNNDEGNCWSEWERIDHDDTIGLFREVPLLQNTTVIEQIGEKKYLCLLTRRNNHGKTIIKFI